MLSPTNLLLISCTYEDHITLVVIYSYTKRWSMMIASRANVVLIHYELLTNVSIAEEHCVGIHNCHPILRSKSLCQRRTDIDFECQQSPSNRIMIRYQWFMSVPKASGDVLLTQFFPIFNQSKYTFNDFGLFLMVYGVQGLGSPLGNIHLPLLSSCHTSKPSSGAQLDDVHKNLNCMAGTKSSHT